MKNRLRDLLSTRAITLLITSALLAACAGSQQNEQPVAVDMTQCQNIADRAVRSSCMDAAGRVRNQTPLN